MPGSMPVPFRKRKRQQRGRVSKHKTENLTGVAPEAAESEEGTPSDCSPEARTEDQGKCSEEYGPL